MILRAKLGTYLLLGVICHAASYSPQSHSAQATSKQGFWISGDMHIHTALSADAKSSLQEVVHKGFDEFGLDYMAISNHLRNNSRDNFGDPELSTLYTQALGQYELSALQQLQPKYADKLLITSFEWDAPAHDHMNIGMLVPLNNMAEKLALTHYFEYRFGAKNSLSDFTQKQLDEFKNKGVTRQNASHADTISALKWLQRHYPQSSYVQLNHPTRYANSYSMQDIREFNDAAPDVFFLVEGMVGNQFNGERGDYNNASRAGLLGGVDPFVAELGGNWDALLGEGRHIWNMANSDHHFKIALPYASGYFPGEYAKTYLYVAADKPASLSYTSWLSALKSGNSFAVYGDLINALDFHVAVKNTQIHMGQTLTADKQQRISINIRVKQGHTNNRQRDLADNYSQGKPPALHHIDLIVGEVKEKAQFGTPAYDAGQNKTTRVLHSFTARDWQIDSAGYYSMSYTLTATTNQYLRLRGTNLDYNETDLTVHGEPQRSKIIKSDAAGSQVYYQRIDQRNYKDLWFYSNPIFIQVRHDE